MSTVPNVYAYRGRQLLTQYHARHKNIPDHKLSRYKEILRNPSPTPNSPICIIGAGTAGLYTAMIFESLGISYQIIDADTKERVGGRLFTYHFPGGGAYDYYVSSALMGRHRVLIFLQDVGAMRFPDTPFMKRVFDLAENRNLRVTLIPYIMQMIKPTPNTFLFYNNRGVNNQDSSITGDPFGVSGYIKDQNLTTPAEVSQRVATAIQPFRDYFRAENGSQPDIATGMQNLFDATNPFSMRSYMFQILGMSFQDINWCETLDKSTGWYDRALTESTYLDTFHRFLIVKPSRRSRYREPSLQLAHSTPPWA